jgi:hypothetical protein
MVATLLVAGFDVADIAYEFRTSANTIYRLRQQVIAAAAGSAGEIDESAPNPPSSERRPRWAAVSVAIGTVALLALALTSIVSSRERQLLDRSGISAESPGSGSKSASGREALPAARPKQAAEVNSPPNEAKASSPQERLKAPVASTPGRSASKRTAAVPSVSPKACIERCLLAAEELSQDERWGTRRDACERMCSTDPGSASKVIANE